VIAALLVAAGFALRRSVSYHATYIERIEQRSERRSENKDRMNAQERDLKKGPVDGEETR
jgi:hypothetical protein